MSDLSDCCYGMGFGPEGDGVALHHKVRQAEARGFYEREVLTVADAERVICSVSGGPSDGRAWVVPGGQKVTINVSRPRPNREISDAARAHARVIMSGIQHATQRDRGSFENIQCPQWAFEDKPETNAKPALPALTRQAGEKYKGLGFCDGMDQ